MKQKKRMSAEEHQKRLKEGLTYVKFPNDEKLCREYVEMYFNNARNGNSEILSFGGGTQSTALLYRGVRREIEGLGAAIFADTGWERDLTYENVKECIEYAYGHGIPVFVVANGNIREDTLNPEKRAPSMPFFISTEKLVTIENQRQELVNVLMESYPSPSLIEELYEYDSHTAWVHRQELASWEKMRDAELDKFEYGVKVGEIKEYMSPPKVAMLRRQCTNEYKIRPIQKLVRGLTGCSMHYPATQWIGISLDEVTRMKKPRERYMQFRYPLIEDRWDRQMCIDYIAYNGYKVPVRSSCPGCPYHDKVEWNSLNEKEFAEVCEFDEKIRELGLSTIGLHGKKDIAYTKNNVYLRRDLKPVRERTFDETEEDTGQLQLFETKDTACDEGGCFL